MWLEACAGPFAKTQRAFVFSPTNNVLFSWRVTKDLTSVTASMIMKVGVDELLHRWIFWHHFELVSGASCALSGNLWY
jgi:hypothetical protein